MKSGVNIMPLVALLPSYFLLPHKNTTEMKTGLQNLCVVINL